MPSLTYGLYSLLVTVKKLSPHPGNMDYVRIGLDGQMERHSEQVND